MRSSKAFSRKLISVERLSTFAKSLLKAAREVMNAMVVGQFTTMNSMAASVYRWTPRKADAKQWQHFRIRVDQYVANMALARNISLRPRGVVQVLRSGEPHDSTSKMLHPHRPEVL